MSNKPILNDDGILEFDDSISVAIDTNGTLVINGVELPIVNSMGVLQFITDKNGVMETPNFVLCKASKDKIGVLRCVDKKMSVKFNDIGNISFKIYRYIDNEPNPYYDLVKGSKYIYVPNINYYRITSCNIQSENTENEYKECTAEETQCNLLNRKLDTFVVNMGTVESIEEIKYPGQNRRVKFCDKINTDLSLLHCIIEEKAPEWTIGHVDVELCDQERSFEVSIQDVYSFLTQDVSTAFDCVFFFDTINNIINVYKTENTGKSTNIHISHKNLASSFSVNTSDDDIKTYLKLTGEDDLTIREINMGYDGIYILDYYHDPEFMTQGLYDAFTAWKEKRAGYEKEYTEILAAYQNQITEVNKLLYYGESDGNLTTVANILAIPEEDAEEVFGKYSKNGLQDLIDIIDNQMSVYSKLGYGDETHKYYESKYLPLVNRKNLLNKVMEDVDKQISDLKAFMYGTNTDTSKILYLDERTLDDSVLDGISYYNRMREIQADIDMAKNFTEDQLKELSTFIKEDELDDSNYVITDSMTDEERYDMLYSFLDYGRRELEKVAQPTYSFSASLANLFSIPEFKEHASDFQCGNYITVSINDNYRLDKVRILGYDIDFEDKSNFTVSFGNVMQGKEKNILTDMTDALTLANRTATSVSFNASNWSQGAKEASEIYKNIEDGLLSAGYALTDGSLAEFVIDKRGLFVKASDYLEDGVTPNDYAQDQIFIGGGRILFTDDDWTTVSEAIGRIEVNGEDTFGVIAKAVIAGYIEGSEITGGRITGTTISNGDGTFVADENGKVTCSDIDITGGTINIGDNLIVNDEGTTTLKNANVSGSITATSLTITGDATIGGFKVSGTALYNNEKSGIDTNKQGVYLGNDGISTGNSTKYFKATKNGDVTCNSITVNGGAINGGSINIKDKFTVDTNGNVVCKSIKITGDANQNTTIGGSYVDSSGNIVCTSSGNIILDNTDPAGFGAIMIEYPKKSDGTRELFSLIRPYMEKNNYNITYNGVGYKNMYLGAFETSNVICGNPDGYDGSEPYWNPDDGDTVVGFFAEYGKIDSLFCSSGYLGSQERIKDEITLCEDNALNIINNSKIYNYVLKKERQEGKKYGFVIERETPEEVINKDKTGIDFYSMSSINWKGTQELYSLYKAQQSEIESLKLEVNELKKLIIS